MTTHGGARPGAGRKRGSRNKREVNWNGSLLFDPALLPGGDDPAVDVLTGVHEAELGKMSPLAFLTRMFRNRALAPGIRADAAKAALPYAHARLAPPKDDQPALPGMEIENDQWVDDLPPVSQRN